MVKGSEEETDVEGPAFLLPHCLLSLGKESELMTKFAGPRQDENSEMLFKKNIYI